MQLAQLLPQEETHQMRLVQLPHQEMSHQLQLQKDAAARVNHNEYVFLDVHLIFRITFLLQQVKSLRQTTQITTQTFGSGHTK